MAAVVLQLFVSSPQRKQFQYFPGYFTAIFDSREGVPVTEDNPLCN